MSQTTTTTIELRPSRPQQAKMRGLPADSDANRASISAHSPPITTAEEDSRKLLRANLIIFQVSTINFLTSMSTGMITTGLPAIATDLHLEERLYLWPASVFGLTAGATLLLAGAVADVIGARSVELVGNFLLGIFTLACGLSTSGIQIVMFRAFQGIANAMHQPCSVSLVSQFVPSGKRRNLGFACLGLSMPLGFSLGLVLEGIFIDTIGWRVGFYIAGSVLLVQVLVGIKLIPADIRAENMRLKLQNNIDWIGGVVACAGLSMLSYMLAIISTDSNNIKQPSSIVILVISVLLLAFFPVWMHIQTKRNRPPLIPNEIWKNLSFSTVCILTMLTWGVMNSMELFCSLYLIVGAILNFSTGYFVDRVPAFWLILTTSSLTAVAPLLMALIDPHWSYWRGAFFAQCLAPMSGDVLFTVGLIVVSESFPEDTQALAGAVFNTVAFFGMALGMNSMQVVSLLVTKGTQYRDKSSPGALLKGYQASFWAMFGMTLGCAVLCVLGLRKIGRIGLKKE